MTRAEANDQPTQPIIRFALGHPGLVIRVTTLLALVLALLAALPSIWPQVFSPLAALEVDTDPENMLSQDEAVRVFHNRMKRAFSIYDMVVVGVVNETHPAGVFNPQTLGNVYALTEYAKTLRWPDDAAPDGIGGVIEQDILAPSTLDNIEQDGLGTVRFDWLMPAAPTTQQEAEVVRDRALKIPFLKGTVVSEDAKALSLYLPLSSKHLTYRTYTQLRDRIAELEGDERYFITGLPVAEDNFGVEMFIQMAISAPLSMLIIFLLMWFFFRKLSLVVSPMIIAMVSVICTMGLLIVTGHTVHIMSSMIPIFIMPIAVLDSVHILSQFFDRYQETSDRRTTIERVMRDLYKPMLYTSLTTAAGFASLALAPIPPVQVFGLFVAFGVMLAWLLTITFIPAYIMRMPEASLQGFGMPGGPGGPSRNPLMARLLHWLGDQTFRWARPILLLTVVGSAISVYGITRIVINDNPIRWFAESHQIRVADAVLNEHFGGTYMAYLSLTPDDGSNILERLAEWRAEQAPSGPEQQQVLTDLQREAVGLARAGRNDSEALNALDEFVQGRLMAAQGVMGDAWEQAAEFVAAERLRLQVFKQPEVLAYLVGLQDALAATGSVGKTNSVVDIVKTVHRELLLGEEAQFRIPDSAAAVAQTLLVFQNSHRPQDLWHFVTPDFRRASIWVQMNSGDNLDMTRVVDSVDRYLAAHRPPAGLEARWYGLTYINMVWQERMVTGMLRAFLGSFLIVFLMMLVMLRSGLWALLSMIPLTMTIGSIYGIIGLIGKDYDMPVAVLSSLSLGLAVDFAIHFLVRARILATERGSWKAAAGPVFGAPARAITRNGLVVSLGFLPLLLAPLVPYQTVGALIAAILIASGAATLVLLPALIRVLEPWLFPRSEGCRMTCNYLTCTLLSLALVGIVLLNLYQFAGVSLRTLGWALLAALIGAGLLCQPLARRRRQVAQADAALGSGDNESSKEQ